MGVGLKGSKAHISFSFFFFQLNMELCVSLVSEPVKHNLINQTQSHSIHYIVFQ